MSHRRTLRYVQERESVPNQTKGKLKSLGCMTYQRIAQKSSHERIIAVRIRHGVRKEVFASYDVQVITYSNCNLDKYVVKLDIDYKKTIKTLIFVTCDALYNVQFDNSK